MGMLKKNLGVAKKKGRQEKFRRNEVKYSDFKHFLGKYSQRQ